MSNTSNGRLAIKCAKCNAENWIKKPPEKRINGIPEEMDLECSSCGADYCAKNRKYEWVDEKAPHQQRYRTHVLIFGQTFFSGAQLLDSLEASNPVKPMASKKGINLGVYEVYYPYCIYKVVRSDTTARGYHADKVYIETGIDNDIITHIILPIVCSSRLPESERVVYF